MCELCLLGMRDPSLPHDSVSGASSSADTAMMAIKPSLNWDQVADQIATTGWSTAATSAITYAYRSTNTSDPGFAKFNAAQIQATELALDLWSDVANISFQRVTSNGTAYSNNATILFSADRDSGGYAWAYFPGSTSSSNIAGDVFINTSNGWFTDMAPGSYDFTTIVHEIGHAIGLNHPGAYNGGSPTYAADAEYAQDSNQYTVMSYFDASATGADHGWTSASTPLLHDIAAAQLLYGANMATRATDTIYGFNSNADKSVFQITGASQDVVFAIWDGGGYDTLDFSGYSDAQVINLAEETFSSVGGLTDNIAIARGVVIENATGGSGNDEITGNQAANRLAGADGNDIIEGNEGADYLFGGSGSDNLSGGVGGDHLWGGLGADQHIGGSDAGVDYARYDDANYGNLTLRLDNSTLNIGAVAVGDVYVGIEGLVGGAGNDSVYGNASANYLFGGGGVDHVHAGNGADYLNGGNGGDHLWGGAGADQHIGGDDAGIDYARYDDANHGNLSLRLDNAALNAGAAAVGDTYSGIEGLVGGFGNDVVVGNASANYLFGGGGADYIDGLAGNDYLNGGAGADRFRFSTALGTNNVDRIADFERGVDDMLLSRSIFTAIGTSLTADELVTGAAAIDANDYIVYDNAIGALLYDVDGNGVGAAVQFATIATGTVLDISDFVMV